MPQSVQIYIMFELLNSEVKYFFSKPGGVTLNLFQGLYYGMFEREKMLKRVQHDYLVSYGLIIIFLLAVQNFFSQNQTSKKYTLKECLDIALANNLNVTTAKLDVEYLRQLKKTSSEMP